MKKTRSTASKITYRMGFKKLSALNAGAGESEAAESEGEDGEEEESKAPEKRPPSATAILVAAAFEAAVPPPVRRRLAHGKALAATIVVPTSDWVRPLAAHVKAAFGDRWHLHIPAGFDRKRDTSAADGEVARDLARGMCVMGISADASALPAVLTAGTDIAISIPPPDAKVLRKAIARFTRRSAGELPEGTAAGLDLHQIIAAFRPGTGALAVLRRLESAAAAGRGGSERVPALASAVEYGEARTWGLDLARDIADFRAGKIAWRDLDRGICIHSPPGFGKSWFPKVLAQGCGGIALVSTSVGSWFAGGPGYLDSVVKQCRESFARAAALAAPVSLLHLDEIDALPDRNTMSARGREWWNVVVSDVLTMLDSTIAGRANVIVIGSTNAIDRVDPALLRPGRLEKIVAIEPLDLAGTINVAKFHLDGELAGELDEVGEVLRGRSPAEIMYAIRGARRAARHAGRVLRFADLENAAMPAEALAPARLFRLAVHEAAHAVAALALRVGAIERVVLQSSGGAGGRTVVDYDDHDLPTRGTIEDRVTIALAARAAERQFTGALSSGAGGGPDSDLGLATVLATEVRFSLGLAGSAFYAGTGPEMVRDVALDPRLRSLVERDLRRLERRAARLVAANRAAIAAVASRLAEKRRLNGSEVEGLVRGRLVAEAGRGRRAPRGHRQDPAREMM